MPEGTGAPGPRPGPEGARPDDGPGGARGPVAPDPYPSRAARSTEMPILPAEPEMYPSTLWREDCPRDDRRRRWWCLHTRPRREKALARALRTRGLAHY